VAKKRWEKMFITIPSEGKGQKMEKTKDNAQKCATQNCGPAKCRTKKKQQQLQSDKD